MHGVWCYIVFASISQQRMSLLSINFLCSDFITGMKIIKHDVKYVKNLHSWCVQTPPCITDVWCNHPAMWGDPSSTNHLWDSGAHGGLVSTAEAHHTTIPKAAKAGRTLQAATGQQGKVRHEVLILTLRHTTAIRIHVHTYKELDNLVKLSQVT